MVAKRFFLLAFIVSVIATGCAVTNKNYNPDKKYSRKELQDDYTLLKNILETKHPSLYWYTPKDSMNYYFDSLYQNIADSMTEYQFGWQVLAPLINKIRCGHTSFLMSDDWGNFIRKRRSPSFPLYIKAWKDTMVVIGNLNKKDSIIKPGTLITSINGMDNKTTITKMLSYLPLDGYAENVNYVRISSNFPFYHRSYFGTYKNYRVGYIDSNGVERKTLLPMYNPAADTLTKPAAQKTPAKKEKVSRKEMRKIYRENARSFEIDTSINTAIITLNTFTKGKGRHLRKFFRQSFKTVRKEKIPNVILDLRNNGGGDINMCALLAKYFSKQPFKVADSSYAITKSLKPYTHYVQHGFFINLGLFFLTSKKNGQRHFNYWENHTFNPKTKNHFNGNAYILISGPTFSASTLFCNLVKGQDNIKLAGEETGGGWHGNDGLMIPTLTLPNTKLKVTLPIFRIVQYKHVPKDGRGVVPDIYIPPTVESVRRFADRKMEVVKEIIKQAAK